MTNPITKCYHCGNYISGDEIHMVPLSYHDGKEVPACWKCAKVLSARNEPRCPRCRTKLDSYFSGWKYCPNCDYKE